MRSRVILSSTIAIASSVLAAADLSGCASRLPDPPAAADAGERHDDDDGGVTDAGAPAPDFCKRRAAGALFCSDFEGPPQPPFGWTEAAAVDATMEIAEGYGRGGGSALRVRATLLPDASRDVWLREDLTVPLALDGRTRVTVSFAFSFVQTSLSYAGMGGLSLSAAGDASALFEGVTARASGRVGASAPDETVLDAVGPGWHEATVTLTRVGATFTRAVSIDGRAAGELAGRSYGDGGADLRLGVFHASPGIGELDVLYDDVLVTAE